jgi:hypothetical protein
LNTASSTTTAPARVTTARLTPRARSAGRATATPVTAASAAATSGAIGNGTPTSTARRLSENPATPAKAI